MRCTEIAKLLAGVIPHPKRKQAVGICQIKLSKAVKTICRSSWAVRIIKIKLRPLLAWLICTNEPCSETLKTESWVVV